jgi:hypothetical protein
MASVQLLASTGKGPVIIQGWDDKLQGFLVGEPASGTYNEVDDWLVSFCLHRASR